MTGSNERHACEDAIADPGGHGLENGTMDAKQEHGKAGKEEKEGDMEQQW
jgi:hypothetical protein